jgi:hypothetical protein
MQLNQLTRMPLMQHSLLVKLHCVQLQMVAKLHLMRRKMPSHAAADCSRGLFLGMLEY